MIAVAVAGFVVVGAGAALVASGRFRRVDTSAALRDRTQLTFTGKTSAPTVSADGKQLAYFTKECSGADCRFAIDVQDVGSTTTRRVLEGATAAYGLAWSPDRRNLVMNGTVGGRYGTHIVSALGGPARFLTAGAAAFYAGGDSLLLGAASPSADSSFVVRIAGLDGTVRDSLHVPGPGLSLASLVSVPGTSRLVAMVIQPPRGLWQVLDRSGKVTGKFATHQDTIYSGRFSNLSVTADGTQMTVDDGSYSFSVIAANVSDLIKGTLPAGAPLMQASNRVSASVSPDGQRLLMRRSVPTPNGGNEMRLSIGPFSGGAETPVNATGSVVNAQWVDSSTVAIYSLTAGGARLARTDIRTGAASQALQLADSTIGGATALPDGWAWIPRGRDRIIVERTGKRHEIPKPAWYAGINQIDASPDGARLLMVGWSASTGDTLRVDVVPVAGGPTTEWSRSFAEDGSATWLADGTIAFTVWSSIDAAALRQLTGPGQTKSLGALGHVANTVSLSKDLARATIMWREYRGDAWMYRVVKP
jgi:Tol biopolymer transport system component